MKKTPARTDVHDQKLLIVVLSDGTHHTVYNKREAARLAASQGRWVGAEDTFFSKMKRAFQHGGTRAEIGFGMLVLKTDTPSPHRSKPLPRRPRVTGEAFPSCVQGQPPDRMFCMAGDPNNHGSRRSW